MQDFFILSKKLLVKLISISVNYNSVHNKFVEKKITEQFILIRFEFNKNSRFQYILIS